MLKEGSEAEITVNFLQNLDVKLREQGRNFDSALVVSSISLVINDVLAQQLNSPGAASQSRGFKLIRKLDLCGNSLKSDAGTNLPPSNTWLGNTFKKLLDLKSHIVWRLIFLLLATFWLGVTAVVFL